MNVTVSGGDITNGSDIYSCGYGFVVEESEFKFSSAYVPHYPNATVPTVLDWSVGNRSCEEAITGKSYVCQGNSSCLNPEFMEGYRCKCLDGFIGNPYLPHIGCQGTWIIHGNTIFGFQNFSLTPIWYLDFKNDKFFYYLKLSLVNFNTYEY